MTILERYNAVKNTTLRDKLLHNYDAKYVADCREAGSVDSDRTALQYGFQWKNSREGDTYWRTLAMEMDDTMTLDEAFDIVYPPKTSADAIKHAGFRFPPAHARKDDPRGKEYGYFIVLMDTDKYTVTKFDYVNNIVWSATFTEDNFLAWARDNT